MNKCINHSLKLLAVLLVALNTPSGLLAQSGSHMEADIMLALPTGEYRSYDNPDRAEPGFGFRLEYFLPLGEQGFGINPAFSGLFNKNQRFKSTNTRFFKVSGGWYSHLILGAGPAYYRRLKNLGVKAYVNAGLNFTAISDSEEKIIQTGQIIETHDFESGSVFCYDAGFSFIIEERVILGLSYINLGDLDYQVSFNQVNSEEEQQRISFTAQSINIRLGLLF